MLHARTAIIALVAAGIVFSVLLTEILVSLTGSTHVSYSLLQILGYGPQSKAAAGGQESRNPGALKVYMYDLPERFTYDVVEKYWAFKKRKGKASKRGFNARTSYPNHQHMAEWWLFQDLLGIQGQDARNSRSAATRVPLADEADVIFVPFFSSLSMKVDPFDKSRLKNSNKDANNRNQNFESDNNDNGNNNDSDNNDNNDRINNSNNEGEGEGEEGHAQSAYSNSEAELALLEWVTAQPPWRRSGGRDHVFVAQHPNAMWRVRRHLRNSILLVSDFAKFSPLEGSLAKDVVLPYVHRVAPYLEQDKGEQQGEQQDQEEQEQEEQAEGGKGMKGGGKTHERPTLLFFVGARHRKEGGSVRDRLFRVLENETGVALGEGRQNRAGIAAAQDGMRSARFCLHPAGDTPSGGRLFDAIVSACIPVVVSDLIELPFEDVLDYSQFCVFVSMEQAVVPGYLVNLLREGVTAQQQARMRAKLREVGRFFQYDHEDGAVNMIWRKIATKVPAVKEQINRSKRLTKDGLRSCRCECLPHEEDSMTCNRSSKKNLEPSGSDDSASLEKLYKEPDLD
eukprot:jgi/Mesen1/9266/ME000006S09265